MIRRRLAFPWEKKYIITCTECGGKIETQPLWHWEKEDDKIHELQPFFCHRIDSTLMKQIPVLTKNDWAAKQKLIEYENIFRYENGQAKPYEAVEHLFNAEKGPPEIFLLGGIFPLIVFFTETELKALFLLLYIEPSCFAKQTLFMKTMQISCTYVSMILKKFAQWKFVKKYRGPAKGRARGRQIYFSLSDEVRARLDKDLSDFDFLRNEVSATVRPIALCFRELAWREDLGLLDREN